MTTLLLSHQICVRHEMPGSPESPARLEAIEQALQAEQFSSLQREDCPQLAKIISPLRMAGIILMRSATLRLNRATLR